MYDIVQLILCMINKTIFISGFYPEGMDEKQRDSNQQQWQYLISKTYHIAHWGVGKVKKKKKTYHLTRLHILSVQGPISVLSLQKVISILHCPGSSFQIEALSKNISLGKLMVHSLDLD